MVSELSFVIPVHNAAGSRSRDHEAVEVSTPILGKREGSRRHHIADEIVDTVKLGSIGPGAVETKRGANVPHNVVGYERDASLGDRFPFAQGSEEMRRQTCAELGFKRF